MLLSDNRRNHHSVVRTPYDKEDWAMERMPWPESYFDVEPRSASPTETPIYREWGSKQGRESIKHAAQE
jgi:hypothetical protein